MAAAAAFGADRTTVTVTIEPKDIGVVARFALDRPVRSFRLSYPEDDIRDRTWKFAAPDFKREDTLITRTDGMPFGAFTVKIEPLNEPTGATYPCLFRVGSTGFAFYAGYFVGVEDEFETTIEVATGADRTVVGFPLGGNTWRFESAFHRNSAHRYVYVGPHNMVSETRYARFVLPPGLAAELVARIRENVDGAIAYYAQRLARPLASKPLIIVAPNFAYEHPGLQGDTTMGPTVALRLFGERWKTFDSKSDRFDHYIAHEVAHFWTSDTFHAAKGSPAWMWEGGAELLALAARIAVMKRLTLSGRRDHIENALNTCATSLFDHPLAGRNRSGVTYSCGETLYWIADVAEKRRTRGRSDIFSIWRRIFERADSNGGIYTLQNLLTFAATSVDASRAFSLFLSGTGTERWQALPDVLRPLGVELAKEELPHDALRHIAMWHILDMTCADTGRRGMRRETDYLKLDTDDRCGPLSSDPEVDTLNGRNLFTDMPAAYAAAQAACASSGDIVLTRTGKPVEWTLPCTKPLPSAPPKFRIVSTP